MSEYIQDTELLREQELLHGEPYEPFYLGKKIAKIGAVIITALVAYYATTGLCDVIDKSREKAGEEYAKQIADVINPGLQFIKKATDPDSIEIHVETKD